MLGVEPVTAGFKEFVVRPSFQIEGVTWEQGRVPTLVGAVFVRWEVFSEGGGCGALLPVG